MTGWRYPWPAGRTTHDHHAAPRSASSGRVPPDCCCRTCCTCAASSSIVLEARSRDYVEHRIRAGVLEHVVAQLLIETGVGARMQADGLPHEGVILRFGARDHRIDFRALTGKHVTVYSQHHLVRDLIAARLAAGGTILFEAEGVSLHDIDTDRPRIRYRQAGAEHELDLRRHRRLRRLPRHQPPGDGAASARVRAGLSVRLARHPGRRGAVIGRAGLCQPRSRLRAAVDALAHGQPALSAMRAGRGPGRLVGRSHLGRVADTVFARRRLHAARKGASPRRASRRCAASWRSRCSTAGCSWPAIPRTSCRPPGRRASTSRPATSRCWPARWRRSTGAARRRCSMPIRRPVSIASGRCSGFPGG